MNNKIIIFDENQNEEIVSQIDGLTITFNGKNNVVKIGKGSVFQSSRIILSNNCEVNIKKTNKYGIRNLFSMMMDHSKIKIGRDFSCVSMSISLNDEKNLSVFIGDHCLAARNITIRPSDGHIIYDINTKELLNKGEDIVIGNHAWIGLNCVFLKGAKVNDGSIIGANSLINKKFNDKNVVIAGSPAKIIKRGVNWDRRSPRLYDQFIKFEKNRTNYKSSFGIEQSENHIGLEKPLIPVELEKSENPLVSVVIPVFNAEDYLGECLDSVVNQTLRNIEIICVNDGSTDSSLDMLKEYQENDDRLKIISQENQGAGVARNQGLKAAKGKYLSILDADDFFELNMLEVMCRKALVTDADVTICRTDGYDSDKCSFFDMSWTLKERFLPEKDVFNYRDMKEQIFSFAVGWSWDKLFKSSFVFENELEFQDLRSTNDMLFVFLSLVKAGRITIVDEDLAHQRRNVDTSLSKTREKDPLCFYDAIKALKEELVKADLFGEVEQSFVNWSLHFCFWHVDTNEKSEYIHGELKNRIFKELDFYKYPKDYFYDRKLYNRLKEKPDVSIILPVFNVEEYLRECLDSVVNQTLKNIEIICVNDGSTDDSLSILKEYKKKDSRIKIISKPNAGYGHTMNVGLDAATGEYIGIVEPDDYVALDMYETLYNEAIKNDVEVIKADFYRFTGTGESIKKAYDKVAREDCNYNRVINPQNELGVFRFIMNTWNGIYKRDFIEKYNIRHNETPGASFQDNGLWFQTLAFATRTYFLNKPFYMNRRDNQGSSVHDKGKVFAMCEEHDFMRNILDNSPKLKENPEFKEKVTYYYQLKRFDNYVFTLNRIGPEFYKMFLEKFHEDYVLAAENKELDEELFSKREWDLLQLIIKDPTSVNENDFKIGFRKSSDGDLFYKKRKFNRLLSFLYILKKEKLNPKKIYRLYKARGQIKSLNLFDEGYYLTNYSDVRKSNMNPLDHYIYMGWMEKRSPSKKFDGNYYLMKYSDVKKSKTNPLVHYVLHGKEEGRFPNHPAEINSPQNITKNLQSDIKNLENTLFKLNNQINLLNETNRKREQDIENINRNYQNKIDDISKKVQTFTKVFTIRHINKEKIACEMGLFKGLGVTREKRSPQIIVSLTSYPDRIYDIHYGLYSLLNQNFKPDKLILWLSKEEFPNLEEDLPLNLLNLEKHGLKIRWTEENFRSYDKLIHSLKEYPNDIIVTADDDVFYPKDWLEILYENYDGQNVISNRARLISFESGSIKPYNQWELEIENDELTILNFPTGVGGNLYPPNVFYKDVLNHELFLKISPDADDIWFWGMVVLNNRKFKVSKNGYRYVVYTNPERELSLNDDGTLFKENQNGGRNDKQLSAILEYYPEIKVKLLEELNRQHQIYPRP